MKYNKLKLYIESKRCCINCKHVGIFYSSELGRPICEVNGIIKEDTEKENNCKYFEEE